MLQVRRLPTFNGKGVTKTVICGTV